MLTKESHVRAVEEPWTPLLADEVEFPRLNGQHRENMQLVRLLNPADASGTGRTWKLFMDTYLAGIPQQPISTIPFGTGLRCRRPIVTTLKRSGRTRLQTPESRLLSPTGRGD